MYLGSQAQPGCSKKCPKLWQSAKLRDVTTHIHHWWKVPFEMGQQVPHLPMECSEDFQWRSQIGHHLLIPHHFNSSIASGIWDHSYVFIACTLLYLAVPCCFTSFHSTSMIVMSCFNATVWTRQRQRPQISSAVARVKLPSCGGAMPLKWGWLRPFLSRPEAATEAFWHGGWQAATPHQQCFEHRTNLSHRRPHRRQQKGWGAN